MSHTIIKSPLTKEKITNVFSLLCGGIDNITDVEISLISEYQKSNLYPIKKWLQNMKIIKSIYDLMYDALGRQININIDYKYLTDDNWSIEIKRIDISVIKT